MIFIGVTYCCQVVSVILDYFFFFCSNKTTSIRCTPMKDIFRLPDKMFYGTIKDIHNSPFGMQTSPFKWICLINYSFVSSSLVASFQIVWAQESSTVEHTCIVARIYLTVQWSMSSHGKRLPLCFFEEI